MLKDGCRKVEILLITSKSSNLLVLPKGGWEVDETLEAAAARETLEEAGVIGDLEGPKRGPYVFQNKNNGPCKAYMYIMKVKEELDEWPEQQARQRNWVSTGTPPKKKKKWAFPFVWCPQLSFPFMLLSVPNSTSLFSLSSIQ